MNGVKTVEAAPDWSRPETLTPLQRYEYRLTFNKLMKGLLREEMCKQVEAMFPGVLSRDIGTRPAIPTSHPKKAIPGAKRGRPPSAYSEAFRTVAARLRCSVRTVYRLTAYDVRFEE